MYNLNEIHDIVKGYNGNYNLNLRINKYSNYMKNNKKDDKVKMTAYGSLPNSSFLFNGMKQLYKDSIEFVMKTQDKLTIGIGSENVQDTSITLHDTYGFPYIPSQSIKGKFRNYIMTNYFSDYLKSEDKFEKIEKKIFEDKLFSWMFGNNDNKGNIIFFDALPLDENSKLDVDIMCVHYKDYYSSSNNTYPTDDSKPNIIEFYVVKNAMFIFLISDRDSGVKLSDTIFDNSKLKEKIISIVGIDQSMRVQEVVSKLLVLCLEQEGIGAKTAVGYGYLKRVDFDCTKFCNVSKDEYEFSIKDYLQEKYLVKIDEMYHKFVNGNDQCKQKMIMQLQEKDGYLIADMIRGFSLTEVFIKLQKENKHHEVYNALISNVKLINEKIADFGKDLKKLLNKNGTKKMKKKLKEKL